MISPEGSGKIYRIPFSNSPLVTFQLTKIDKESPINYLQVNNIIVEANRKKINTIGDLDNVVKLKLRSDENNLLIAIYNNQNQRTYVGVKLK